MTILPWPSVRPRYRVPLPHGGGPQALADGQVRRLQVGQGAQLVVWAGQLWLTVSGDAQDHILRPGDTWLAGGRRDVVVQAVGGLARFSCPCVAPAWPPDRA